MFLDYNPLILLFVNLVIIHSELREKLSIEAILLVLIDYSQFLPRHSMI
jgi:hypothetical protein